MSGEITNEVVQSLREPLERHPVYGAVATPKDLQCFMEHHIFSVWDFMSLVKSVQDKIAPSRSPWFPAGDPTIRRFINALVLEEESDIGLPDKEGKETYASHFELYCNAMEEVGANNKTALAFVEKVKQKGVRHALNHADIPDPCRQFARTTFQFIESGKAHVIAAALALGREHIIPAMFRSFLIKIGVTETQAPVFFYYLKRHIHLDEDFHAPWSLHLLNELCGQDESNRKEAVDAAREAIAARIQFWNGVHEAINKNR
jgi:hypothetical protein